MHNDLFSIGPLTLHTYGLMTAIAIIAAVLFIERQMKKKQMDASCVYELAVTCLISGYAGSKLLYLFTVLPELLKGQIRLADAFFGGWVVLGGILGGMAAGYLFCRSRRLPVPQMFDTAMPGIALAQGIGRIGCFFAGCCYGIRWNGPLAVSFTHSEFAPNHVPLFPSQLLSSAGDFLLFGILLLADRRKKRDWEVTACYLLLYSLGRIAVEFFRGDLERGAVGPFSTSQFICLFTFGAGVLMLFMIHGRSSK